MQITKVKFQVNISHIILHCDTYTREFLHSELINSADWYLLSCVEQLLGNDLETMKHLLLGNRLLVSKYT
jgi:hypothetical protein